MNNIGSEDGKNGVKERTFQYQETLPNLPVPDLRKTLVKYLDSVSVHLSSQDFENTKRIVKKFESGVGADLHKLLLERAKREKNWLEQWWEDYAYHIPRYPIMPMVNFGGASPFYDIWPPISDPKVVLKRSSLSIYWMLKYWDLIRKEELPVQYQRGTRWCMNQTHRLFNTCRIPGEYKDELKFSFKSIYEGECPSYIVVMDRGLFWRVDVMDPRTGELYTPPQLEASFEEIRRLSAAQMHGVPVGALTCLERTDWFKERQNLIALSKENADHLKIIEQSILILSFTPTEPATDDQLAPHLICPNPQYLWADKNIVWQIHKTGMLTSNCDHSYLDAIVVLQMNAYVDEMLLKNGHRWNGDNNTKTYPRGAHLKFVTDSKTMAAIGRAMEMWQSYAADCDIILWHHTDHGMEFYKKKRLYADTVVQLAMQLAYLRLHHRPAATYETATTKKYYHGRTETVRSCTPEAIEWAKSMMSRDKASIRRRKFDLAVEKHNRLMAEAMNGEGCDRHLFGLKILALEKGWPTPDIFTDPAWTKSGGDGNFILSSSFIGYSNVWGGVAAMCADGYGTFYKMEADRITFFLTCWKSSKETNLALWRDSLEYSMKAVKKLVLEEKDQIVPVSKY